ncbi:Membralin-like protein [Cocos nucifera]|uniref:Membralin-like protein n=1 Tax=Cocos nucifera TaxID=13894 RepID=A0A8K0ID43_COCNU|nr:Membralin-like protein [Cocos nucifera]
MDPEQTFLRVHARVSGMLSQLLTPRIRLALEYVYLAVAVALFCLLVVMHTNFVQQIISGGLWAQSAADQNIVDFQQETSTENSKIPEVNGDEFTILTAKFWSNWLGSGARRSKLIFRSWKSDKEFLEPQLENAADSSISKAVLDETDIKASTEGHKGLPLSARESFKAAVLHFFTKWHMRLISFWKNSKQFSQSTFELLTTARWNESLDISKRLQALRMENLSSLIVQWLEKRSKAFEPTYLYTVEKGFFLLPEGAKSRHNIQAINITISALNPCFGNRWQQLLINSLVGYDTILTNSLLNYPGQGYLYNFQTKEFYDLSYGHELGEGPARFGDYFVTKCGVLIMSLFVFFTTTMSVSFTLRETQSRMLKFTVQLQHHARHQLPTFQLIFVHVIESLVFVPIMIGILFFLFEFYDDQLLAFLVLTLVWLCELFTMIRYFPEFPSFFGALLVIGSGIPMISSLKTTSNHVFHVPALQRFMRNRGQMQQQGGVQITSSTIYTSTVHIARVNVRNGGVVGNEVGDGPRLHLGPDRPGSAESSETREQSGRDSPDSGSNDLHFPALGPPRQTGTAPGSSLLNPFSSLLLWILGGASSDGIVSFFSMFRDVRDQGQVFPENPQNGEEIVT